MPLFYNYSSSPFTYTWGGKPYTFKAGEVYQGVIISDNGGSPLELNEVLARFFSKHLAEFVLNTPEINRNFTQNETGHAVPTDGYPMKYNTTSIDLLTERGLTAPEVTMPMPSFASELPILTAKEENATISEESSEETLTEAPKKRGRPAKAKEEASPSPEAEFDV